MKEEAYLNYSWVRFTPLFASSKLLLRTSVPLNTVGAPAPPVTNTVNSTNRLGDINAFVFYQFMSKYTATIGAGPLLSAPTATDNPKNIIDHQIYDHQNDQTIPTNDKVIIVYNGFNVKSHRL